MGLTQARRRPILNRSFFGKRGLTLILFSALGLTAPMLKADFKEDYKNGLAAVERKNWSQAEEFMKRAITDNATSSGRSFSFGLKKYVPHYYLGLALAEQGRCRESIVALDESLRQNVISKSENLDKLNRTREGCLERIVTCDRASSKVEEILEEVKLIANRVGTLQRSQELKERWVSGNPSLSSLQQGATDRLSTARSSQQLGNAQLDLQVISRAQAEAQDAKVLFQKLRDQAETQQATVRQAAGEKLDEIDRWVKASESDLRFIAYLQPYPDRLAEAIATLESTLEQAKQADFGTPFVLLDELRIILLRNLNDVRSLVQRPPEVLTSGAELYFAGHYTEALATLQSEEFTDKAAYQVCLLRAAAFHGLSRLGDPAALERSEDELMRCRLLDANTPIVAERFPPSFVQFFRSLLVADENGTDGEDGEVADENPDS